jgi:DegV family protein with EDD domain
VSVRVVTDSSAVIPQPWIDAYPLHIVPLQIAWDDGEVAEDGPYAALAARLARGRQAPKTSAPSPGMFEQLFRELLEQHESLLVVCPPAELSMTVGSATLAARSAGEGRVRVIDGRTAAAGQGIVARCTTGPEK